MDERKALIWWSDDSKEPTEESVTICGDCKALVRPGNYERHQNLHTDLMVMKQQISELFRRIKN